MGEGEGWKGNGVGGVGKQFYSVAKHPEWFLQGGRGASCSGSAAPNLNLAFENFFLKKNLLG